MPETTSSEPKSSEPTATPPPPDARRDPRVDPRPELFGALFVIVQHLTRQLDEALLPLGLTSRQWLLLAVLERWFPARHPSLTEAAARYGTSRQNVKQVALGLQRLGYLRLSPDPADHRTTRLVVTERVGVFREPEVLAQGAAFLDAAFAELDAAELDSLHATMTRWLGRIQRDADLRIKALHQDRGSTR